MFRPSLFEVLILGCVSLVNGATVAPDALQTINGVGASGAWWPIDLEYFPESAQKNMSELLFGKSGLAMTSYRYNIGGGGVFVGNPSRAPETMYVSTGVLNTSADATGSYFLRAAAAANVPVITAFINSAPPAMTTNNRSCGGTLDNSSIPAFTSYIADVIDYWKSENVPIHYISPFNEPDSSFGGGESQCGQEGMIVTKYQRAEVINTLRATLDQAGLKDVGIMADESSTQSNFFDGVDTWLAPSGKSLSSVAHHNYGFMDDATNIRLGDTARNLTGGVEPWFTEICCFVSSDGSVDPNAALKYGGTYDPTIISALHTAKLIWQGFTQAQDAHFDWWLAASNQLGCDPSTTPGCGYTVNPNGWNDGLVYYNTNAVGSGDFTLYIPKRFWVFKHFTTAIPVGAVRRSVDGLSDTFKGLAFTVGENKLTMILLHMADTTESITIDVGAASSFTSSAWQTSATEDWQEVPVSVDGTSVTVQATGFGVISLNLSMQRTRGDSDQHPIPDTAADGQQLHGRYICTSGTPVPQISGSTGTALTAGPGNYQGPSVRVLRGNLAANISGPVAFRVCQAGLARSTAPSRFHF